MDLEAIWHDHKPFILQLGAGALVLAVGATWRGSMTAEAATLARANASLQSDLLDDLARLEGAEGLEKGRAQALGERLEPAVRGALAWRLGDGFALPAGERAAQLYYAGKAAEAAKAVATHAARWNAQVPTTAAGLGLPSEPEDARVPEALAQADLASRAVIALLDAGVRVVTKVEPLEARYEPVTPPGEGARFLRAVPVRLAFAGDTGQVAAALARFQVQGAFLEVLSCRVVRAERAGGPPLEVTLEVQALGFVAEAPASAVVGEAGQASGRRRPRFTRER